MTAGILPARRVRRAPPLPNSVRGSADRPTSDTAELSHGCSAYTAPRTRARHASTNDAASITEALRTRPPSPGQLRPPYRRRDTYPHSAGRRQLSMNRTGTTCVDTVGPPHARGPRPRVDGTCTG